ncbi:MAG: hypothetical protein HY996_11665 [Micrococcales bacterium]|nr:hypothetical protein [Micrococcales bacterium]
MSRIGPPGEREVNEGPIGIAPRRARRKYLGFAAIVLQNAGPDPDAFLGFYRDELKPRLAG